MSRSLVLSERAGVCLACAVAVAAGWDAMGAVGLYVGGILAVVLAAAVATR